MTRVHSLSRFLRTRIWLLVVLLLAAVLVLSQGIVLNVDGGLSVVYEGRVVDEVTGRPIVGATVGIPRSAMDLNSGYDVQATTDRLGSFSLPARTGTSESRQGLSALFTAGAQASHRTIRIEAPRYRTRYLDPEDAEVGASETGYHPVDLGEIGLRNLSLSHNMQGSQTPEGDGGR